MILACLLLALGRPASAVTIDAVGDVNLARAIGRRIDREGPGAPLRAVAALFGRDDLVVGNLECALTSRPLAGWKRYPLRARPAAAAALARFTLLTLANNHSADCGPAGLADTAEAVRRAGVLPFGLGPTPVFLSRHGLRLGFVGLVDLPPDWLRLDAPNAIWARAVRRARAECDVLVAFVHWGVEGSPGVEPRQRRLARQLFGLGVDLILGCHPHVLEPVESFHAGGRGRLVAYSLGNFVFDSPPGPGRRSELLRVRLDRAGVAGWSRVPVRLVRGFPTPLAKPRPERGTLPPRRPGG